MTFDICNPCVDPLVAFGREHTLFSGIALQNSPQYEMFRKQALLLFQKKYGENPGMDILVPYLSMEYLDQYFAKQDKVVHGSTIMLVRSYFFLEALKTMEETELAKTLKPQLFKNDFTWPSAKENATRAHVELRPITPFAFVQHFLKLIPNIVFKDINIVYSLIIQSKADVQNCLSKPSVIAAAAVLIYVHLHMPNSLQESLDKFRPYVNETYVRGAMDRLKAIATTFVAAKNADGTDVIVAVQASEKKSKVQETLSKAIRKIGKALHPSGSGSTNDEEGVKLEYLWNEMLASGHFGGIVSDPPADATTSG